VSTIIIKNKSMMINLISIQKCQIVSKKKNDRIAPTNPEGVEVDKQ
jgi:hypothetical protein